MMRIVCSLLLLVGSVLCMSHTAASAASPVVYPFQNSCLSVDERMDNLLSLLTLEEKQSRLYDGRAFMPGVDRLNISVFEWGQECLRGLINRLSDGNVSNFPQSLGLAASWNTSVFSSMGDVISDEARGRRNGYHHQGVTGKTYLHCWTPVVNIMKDPRWGRSAESYGESPLLTLSYTSALLRALHDDNEQQIKIAPTLKHYTIYDGPEEGRSGCTAPPHCSCSSPSALTASHSAALLLLCTLQAASASTQR
jgi:beta-glucosidase